jgi:hypothetical protein
MRGTALRLLSTPSPKFVGSALGRQLNGGSWRILTMPDRMDAGRAEALVCGLDQKLTDGASRLTPILTHGTKYLIIEHV